jgi:hypothetical protein
MNSFAPTAEDARLLTVMINVATLLFLLEIPIAWIMMLMILLNFGPSTNFFNKINEDDI